jgi:hypothetical protein
MTRAPAIAALLAVAAGTARADDGDPAPSSLAMRADDAPPQGTPAPAAPAPITFDPPNPKPAGQAFDGLRFRFDVGFGIDGGQLNCDNSDPPVCAPSPSGISGQPYIDNYYDQLRVYAYGDAVLASRGLIARPLAAYMATTFRFDEAHLQSTAVPTVYDACPAGQIDCSTVQDLLIRSAWAETDGSLLHRRLGRIRVRAGRQFRYGPAIAHFDGMTVAIDSPVVTASLYGGTRVSLWDFRPGVVQQAISGADLSLDMYQLKRVPLVLSGGVLRFDDITHFEGGLAVQWSPDVFIRASGRMLDGYSAGQRLELRLRISDVTTVRAELENHTDLDWHYDLVLTQRGAAYRDEPGDPRRWLDFGVRRPRTFGSVRAGTVLLSNIDVLLRGAAGVERKQDQPNDLPDSAGFLEGGLAAEVRFRRAVSLGASAVGRTYNRKPLEPGDLLMDQADQLPAGLRDIGERRMLEGGFSARFDTGRRSLSATAEFYGRVEWLQTPFIEGTRKRESRGGARFLVDVWVNSRLRIKVVYDVTSAIDSAPELSGTKSLRAAAEGTL